MRKPYLLLLLLVSLFSCSDVDTPATLMLKAEEHERKGEYNSAVLELKKAAQIEPANPAVRARLGRIYLQTGSLQNAEKEFGLAIQNGLRDEDTLKGYGESLVYQQKYRVVLNAPVFQQANETAFQDTVLNLYGNAHAGLGDYALAVKSFEGALLVNPGSIDALIGLAKIALHNEQFVRASELIDRVKYLDEHNHDAYLLQAVVHSRKNEFLEAEQAYEAILTTKSSQIITPQTFQAFVNLIFLKLKNGELQQAKKFQSDFYTRSGRHPVATYLDALIAYQEGNYERAQRQLQIAIKAMPTHLPTIFLFGATNYALGNYEQANLYLTQFVNHNPTHIPARKLLAATWLKLNKPNEALHTLTRVVPEAGADQQLLVMASAAAISVGDSQAGIRYFKQIENADTGNNVIREQLAKLLLQQNDTEQAIEILSGDKSQSDNSMLLLIQAHVQKGEFGKAKKLVTDAIMTRGKSAHLYTLLGIVNAASGSRHDAVKSYQDALALDSDFIPAKLYLARLELEHGNLFQAEKYFNQIVVQKSDNSAAMFGLAQISEMRGEHAQALGWLKKSAEANQNDQIPQLALGYYYLRTGDVAAALNAAKSAKAIADNFSSSLLLARAYLAKKEYPQATAIFEKLLGEHARYLFLHVELASAYLQQNKSDLARKQLIKANSVEPDNPSILSALARLETEYGERDQALFWINKLITSYPRSAVGYELKGDLFSRSEDYSNAVSFYKQAVGRQAPPSVYLKLAGLYVRQNNHDTAIKILQQGRKEYPQEENLTLTLATLLQKMNKIMEARTYYTELLESNRNNIVVLNNLAYSYIDDDLEKSLEYARRAYQLAPNSHAVIDTLGWVLIQAGKPAEGIAYLEKINTENTHPSIKYHHAFGLYQLRDADRAKEILEQVLKQPADFPEREAAQKLLQKLDQGMSQPQS